MTISTGTCSDPSGALHEPGYSDYQHRHMQRTGWVVGPPMLVEAVTAIWLVLQRPVGMTALQVWSGASLLVVIWLSTALLQVPSHQRLLSGFDATAHRRLVATNWLRTVAWTLRGFVVLWMSS